MKIKMTLGIAALAVAVGTFALALASPRVGENDVGKTTANMQTTELLAVAPTDTVIGAQEGFAIMELRATLHDPTIAAESVFAIQHQPAAVNTASLNQIASTANAPNIATCNHVAARAVVVTDQLALKIAPAAQQFAFTVTGVAQLGSA